MDSSLLLRTVLVLVCIFILFALVSHYNRATTARAMPVEEFAASPPAMDAGAGSGVLTQGSCGSKGVVQGVEPGGNEVYRPVDYAVRNKIPTDCLPRDRLTAEDLLPRDAVDSKWAAVNPAGQGSVGDASFLSAGFHIGTDTVMSSLRNPTYDLRPAPIIEQKPVSLWNQSTIAPDTNTRTLC